MFLFHVNHVFPKKLFLLHFHLIGKNNKAAEEVHPIYLADPGETKGCFTNTVVLLLIDSLIERFFSSSGLYCADTPKQFEIALPVLP